MSMGVTFLEIFPYAKHHDLHFLPVLKYANYQDQEDPFSLRI